MSAGVFKLKDTGDREWYVVVANGVTSRPLRRDLAGGLARKLNDEEVWKVFQAAQEGWNEIAERCSAMLAEMLVSEKLQADDVTSTFHDGAYPRVVLLDAASQTYVVVPEGDQPMMMVGLADTEATVQASQGTVPSGRRR